VGEFLVLNFQGGIFGEPYPTQMGKTFLAKPLKGFNPHSYSGSNKGGNLAQGEFNRKEWGIGKERYFLEI